MAKPVPERAALTEQLMEEVCDRAAPLDHIVLRETASLIPYAQQFEDAHRSADRPDSGIDQGIRIYQFAASNRPEPLKRVCQNSGVNQLWTCADCYNYFS